jgi:transcriptional regulator with XRE-family HTH domain
MHLADYMAERSLSDEDVAAAIGKSRVSVSRYRRKLIRPEWDAIDAIRRYTKGQVTEADWRKLEPRPKSNEGNRRTAARAKGSRAA